MYRLDVTKFGPEDDEITKFHLPLTSEEYLRLESAELADIINFIILRGCDNFKAGEKASIGFEAKSFH